MISCSSIAKVRQQCSSSVYSLIRIRFSVQMGASPLTERKKSIHEILGGGHAADVMLWRRRDVTIGVLSCTFATWLILEVGSYTLLSLTSDVLLLLFSTLFFWAKSASILNRPAPPLPKIQMSEQTITKIANVVRNKLNLVMSTAHDIAMAQNPKLFLQFSGCLVAIRVVGGLTDLITLIYWCIITALAIPPLYERFEFWVHECATLG